VQFAQRCVTPTLVCSRGRGGFGGTGSSGWSGPTNLSSRDEFYLDRPVNLNVLPMSSMSQSRQGGMGSIFTPNSLNAGQPNLNPLAYSGPGADQARVHHDGMGEVVPNRSRSMEVGRGSDDMANLKLALKTSSHGSSLGPVPVGAGSGPRTRPPAQLFAHYRGNLNRDEPPAQPQPPQASVPVGEGQQDRARSSRY
jgi:hypothetical protein